MTPDEIHIQLIFSEVYEISNDVKNLKQLKIDVVNETYFVANQTKLHMKKDISI